LLDTIGKSILDLERCLGEMKHKDLPSTIIFACLTDGLENQSREFTKSKIARMIQAKKDDWQFVFLSADLAAFVDAQGIGISGQSSLAFNRDAMGCKNAFHALSERTSDVRSGRRARVEFEQTDRKCSADPNKAK
jgi:hypothetical protein